MKQLERLLSLIWPVFGEDCPPSNCCTAAGDHGRRGHRAAPPAVPASPGSRSVSRLVLRHRLRWLAEMQLRVFYVNGCFAAVADLGPIVVYDGNQSEAVARRRRLPSHRKLTAESAARTTTRVP